MVGGTLTSDMFSSPRLVEPKLLKAAVYGAHDGIVTTFAVVAGVAGAKLSADIIIILGIANMIADGISMAVGDYLGERSEQRLRQHQKQTHTENGLWKTGLVTFVAFVLAGSLPLFPYFLRALGVSVPVESQFSWSIVATGGTLFLVGTLRTILTKGAWWRNGLEVLGIGAIAATTAYLLGAWVETLVR